jgi:uncharacterized membrane protein
MATRIEDTSHLIRKMAIIRRTEFWVPWVTIDYFNVHNLLYKMTEFYSSDRCHSVLVLIGILFIGLTKAEYVPLASIVKPVVEETELQ